MSKARSYSQRERTDSSRKPEFQTKLKSLLSAGAELDELKASVNSQKFMQTQRSKHDHDFCEAN
jgi:hypothetical protein